MILLNFAHPLTTEQLAQSEALLGQPFTQVIDLPVSFDPQQSFKLQAQALAASIPLTPSELQTAALIVNPPSLNYITSLILAELHGRMGYFPPLLRLRPVADSLPTRFEVAEVLNLQTVRDRARLARQETTHD